MNSLSTHLESVVLPYLSTSALYSTYKDDPLCINIIMEISCLFVAITSTLPHTASYVSFSLLIFSYFMNGMIPSMSLPSTILDPFNVALSTNNARFLQRSVKYFQILSI